MSKKLLVFVFVMCVLAIVLAGCAQTENPTEVTPTLVFITATSEKIEPIVTSTIPPKPVNPGLCFDDLDSVNVENIGIQEAMMGIYGENWYSPLEERDGVFSTRDQEKNGFISINELGDVMNVVVVDSGNAWKFGLKIPDVSFDIGSTIYYGPSYKIDSPAINNGSIQILEYWSYRGTQFVRYLNYQVSQEWNGYSWSTKKEKIIEAWYQIQTDETLIYAGERQPTSP